MMAIPMFLITGNDNAGAPLSGVYTGDGDGTFTSLSVALPEVSGGNAVWGDYDNDERADILISGINSGGTRIVKVFHNDGSSFSEDTHATAALTAIEGKGDIAWGDYNGDGKLDVVMTGLADGGRTMILYKKQRRKSKYPTPHSGFTQSGDSRE